MKILYISSEISPFAKTGGLADVAWALPEAIKELGHDIRTVMPKYLNIGESNHALDPVASFSVQMRNGLQGARLLHVQNGSVPTYFLENDAYFNREGFYGLGDGGLKDILQFPHVARIGMIHQGVHGLRRQLGPGPLQPLRDAVQEVIAQHGDVLSPLPQGRDR